MSSNSDDYPYEEQQFGYEGLSVNNYENSESTSSEEDIVIPIPIPRSIKSKQLKYPQVTYQKPIRYESLTKKISYDETMNLINKIFISNYYDKKRGNALLVNYKQIIKWIDHFENVEFDFKTIRPRNSKVVNITATKNNIMLIGNLIRNDDNQYETDIINEILLLGNGKISLCGGSLIELINRKRNDNDWDLFFHGVNIDQANVLLSDCLELINNCEIARNISYKRTQRVTTVEISTVGFKTITIQFIMRLYDTKDQILLGFDLAPCRIGYNPIDGLYSTVCGGLSIAMRCFPLDTTQRSLSFGYRLDKYLSKGFSILIPGIPFDFEGDIETPDGILSISYQDMDYRLSSCFESDYEDDYGSHLNWYYILTEKYHLITFIGFKNGGYRNTNTNIGDIKDINDNCIRYSISNNELFEMNKNYINILNIRTNKHFLGDKYIEYINSLIIKENENEAKQIWKDRCEWYIQKGAEVAESMRSNNWKIENPGSQSFGKFNPVLEHPKMWYGDNYQSLEVGIGTPQFKTLINCLINILPQDIINLICNHWLKAEVNIARDYLFNLH